MLFLGVITFHLYCYSEIKVKRMIIGVSMISECLTLRYFNLSFFSYVNRTISNFFPYIEICCRLYSKKLHGVHRERFYYNYSVMKMIQLQLN